MTYEALKNKLLVEINHFLDEIFDYNCDVFNHPEISGKEEETSKKIVSILKKHDFNVEYPFNKFEYAFKADFKKKKHKYKVALLVEYDALPEIGHACGHCLSEAISLLAGISLIKLQDELDIDVSIIGTPQEETDGAKVQMVEDGVFDDYNVAIMIHIYDENLVRPKLLALEQFVYEFHGKTAHGATSPWDGINALNGAVLMIHGIDMMRQHIKPDVRIHYMILNGGTAPNIIPEFASIELYARSTDKCYLEEVVEKIDKCAEGASIATGTTWNKFSTEATYYNMKPNPTGESIISNTFKELGIPLNGDPEKIFGSTDAGNVSFACPSFHICLQAVDKGVAIHTRNFAEGMKTERAKKALKTGAKIITLSLLKMFYDKNNIKKIMEEFRST